MTQPPGDRPPRPDDPEGQGAPENEPTVAWTPPEPQAEKPPEQGGPGWAAVPDASDAPAEPPAPEGPAPAEPTAPAPPPAPAGPIISAIPAAPTSTPALPPTAPPGGGWEVPTAAAPLPQQGGYVIAGVGARIVAWLIDILLAGIIPAALALVVVDFSSIIRDAVEAARLDPSGQVTGYTYEIPITLDYILVTLIGLGIQYLYFVGFWTSRWQSTPGMLGLKMRVVNAGTGGTLSVWQATKRWIALGWPLGLLVLIPTLQSASGLIQFGLAAFLFFTTVLNDRKQGLHDKFANSLVIRSVTSGNGATFVGCLVWGVIVIVLGVIVSAVAFTAIWPQMEELIREMPTNAV